MQKIEIFSLLAYEYVFTLYNNSISIMIREHIAEKIHNGEWTSSFPRKKNHAQLNHAKYCWRFVSFECFKAFIEKSLKSPSCHHVFLHSLPYIDLLWEILMIFNAIDCNRDFPLYESLHSFHEFHIWLCRQHSIIHVTTPKCLSFIVYTCNQIFFFSFIELSYNLCTIEQLWYMRS